MTYNSRKSELYFIKVDIPIVNSLGKPAQNWMPVCEVGFLLIDVSLTVWQHICQILDKVTCLLLQDFNIIVSQLNKVAWIRNKESVGLTNEIVLQIKTHLQERMCMKYTSLPSKQRVWLPSRQTQISKHCSSRLRNKTNLRKRSWVWIVIIHCTEHREQKRTAEWQIILWVDFILTKMCVKSCSLISLFLIWLDGFTYIWSERVKVRDERWNGHDVEKKRPQQVVWEMCSDNRPATHHI